jgi:hypothetical protein
VASVVIRVHWFSGAANDSFPARVCLLLSGTAPSFGFLRFSLAGQGQCTHVADFFLWQLARPPPWLIVTAPNQSNHAHSVADWQLACSVASMLIPDPQILLLDVASDDWTRQTG